MQETDPLSIYISYPIPLAYLNFQIMPNSFFHQNLCVPRRHKSQVKIP